MAIRTRTRNQGPVTVRYNNTRPVGGNWITYPTYTNRGKSESITDDGDKDVKRYKRVTHSRTDDYLFYDTPRHLLEQNLFMGLSTTWSEGNHGNALGHSNNSASYTQVTSPPTLASIPAATLKDLFTACLPSLNDGNSLVNFVLELRDARTIMRTIAHVRRTSSRLLRQASQLKRNGIELTKTAADVNLSYNFGIAPFISDIKKLYKTISTIKGRIEWLETNHSKVLIRHSRIKLDPLVFPGGSESTSTAPMGMYYSGTWGGGNVRARVTRRTIGLPTLHGTLKYKYTLESSTRLKNQLSTYLSAFGVEANPKIVWDAIPFSFLVDWVVDVGGFLETFKLDALGIKTVVLDYCYSVKWHAIWQTWSSEYNPYRAIQTSEILIRQAERTYYERQVGTPSLAVVDVSGLGTREFLLGGSLLLANPGSRSR